VPGRVATAGDGLRLAVSVLTRIPCGAVRTDARTVSWAMTLAPFVGAGIGAVAAGVFGASRAAVGTGTTALLPASLALAATVVLTGALHLDGLADSADALGVRGGPEEVRAAMKAPGIGAFGATALAVVLLVDVAAVSLAGERGLGPLALMTACVGSRLAVTWTCRAGVTSARAEGLGAWVAGSVSRRRALTASVGSGGLVAAVAVLLHASHLSATVGLVVSALLAGVLAGELARRAVTPRIGGLTGDVIGAVVECSSMTTITVIALASAAVT
jgi:adenosylcobinamide-GDP ribazoletransferase